MNRYDKNDTFNSIIVSLFSLVLTTFKLDLAKTGDIQLTGLIRKLEEKINTVLGEELLNWESDTILKIHALNNFFLSDTKMINIDYIMISPPIVDSEKTKIHTYQKSKTEL